MNIEIDERYSLNSDERNVILIRKEIIRSGKKKGKIREFNIGYYGTVQATLKGYLRVKINISEATTIQELLQDIKKIEKTIEMVLKGN